MHEIVSDMPFMYGRVAVVVRVALSRLFQFVALDLIEF